MALFKRPDSKFWWFHFEFGGRHYQKSSKTTNKREAREIEAAFRTQLAKGEVGLESKKKIPNFDEAIADFLRWSADEHQAKPNTHRRYVTSAKALLRYFKQDAIDKITPEKIDNFKQWRRRQKGRNTNRVLKPATVNRELACLKAMFSRLVKADVIAKNPVSKVKFLAENSEKMRVLSEDEERLYLMACSQPLRDVAVLILETGCRPEEIYRLQKSNVRLDENCLIIADGKTKAARREIPLSDKAFAVLERRLKSAVGDYLFPSGRGANGTEKPIVKLNNAHTGALKRSGIAKCVLYDLRHTFASRMAMSGCDLVTLAALLGHSRIQMVMRYAHPVKQHKIEAVRKLQQFRENRKIA